jgi:hypothetical protein
VAGFLKSQADSVDEPCMASNKSTRADKSAGNRVQAKPTRKKRRRRRLTDKIRAALALAAALGRRDVTEHHGTLYQARVEEELGGGTQRRSRDTGVALSPAHRNR